MCLCVCRNIATCFCLAKSLVGTKQGLDVKLKAAGGIIKVQISSTVKLLHKVRVGMRVQGCGRPMEGKDYMMGETMHG